MDAWQKIRLERAKEQDLQCANFAFTDDSAIFWVVGLTDQYEIEIDQNADMWPPTCTCEDHAWRPDVLCKHIIFVLRELGAMDEDLADCFWEPQQESIYELLSSVPEIFNKRVTNETLRNQFMGKGASMAPFVDAGYR